ncbi:MAG: hypothetical protein V1889_00575 [archaeon]
MISRKGSEKFYIITSLILGLMVLVIGLYWIFNEYFNQDELDWQVCRQSILVRASLSSEKLEEIGLDVGGVFPLKCKTEVVNVNSANRDEVYDKISKAVAEGWYMFGEGKLNFIGPSFWEKNIVCMAFARIHYTDNALNEFNEMTRDGEDSKGRYNLGFYDYYKKTKIAEESLTYDEYLPVVMFLEENPGFAFVPLGVKMYPQKEDQILIYAIHKKKQGIAGWASKQWIDVASWSTFIAGYLSRNKEMKESAKEYFIEAYGLERSIVMAYSNDIESLGCKFLTIPA